MEGAGGGSLGRAGQANCTLLAAGRFLMAGAGNAWGIRQSACTLLHPHWAVHGAGEQDNPVHPAEIGPHKYWDRGIPGFFLTLYRDIEPIYHSPTHPGKFHHVLLWL